MSYKVSTRGGSDSHTEGGVVIFTGCSLLSQPVATPTALPHAPSSSRAVPSPNVSLLRLFLGTCSLPLIRGEVNPAKVHPSSQERRSVCCGGWEGFSHIAILFPGPPAFLVPTQRPSIPDTPGPGTSCIFPRSCFLPTF